ncbi:MAG: pilus assembly protein N-terminal domain-containing protein [Bryobacterales bacterium]|nr:pilus assembly protein N-terminal domain-containing protein [Bryobacterales bacterium]
MGSFRLLSAACLALALAASGNAADAASVSRPAQNDARSTARDLFVVAGKSIVVQTPSVIQRVVISDPKIAEALPVTQQELVLHGRAEGETSLILWTAGGGRVLFDLKVQANHNQLDAQVEAMRQNLRQEFPDSDIDLSVVGADPQKRQVLLKGTVPDVVGARRAEAMVASLGKPVSLLRVLTPEAEPQILLRVKFANVERNAASELGANFISTGAGGNMGSLSTGMFEQPIVEDHETGRFTISDALNVFLFRPDLDLGMTLKLLQNRRLAEVLAEPNVLAINGKQASFLAGGEFPFPTLQGGSGGVGQITIQFREFGIRINFVPTITARGTIRLAVEPEVSALDMVNGLTIQGFRIPGLATRRVQTEVELEDGQSFAIAGLLDNRTTEELSKIPGLGDIPLLGKLFQSRKKQKTNTELLVLITPELVRPIPAGGTLPSIDMPEPFLDGAPTVAPRHPAMEQTGPVPLSNPRRPVPVETMLEEYDKLSKPRNFKQNSQDSSVLQFIPAIPAAAPAAPAGGSGGSGGSSGGGNP